MASARKNPRTAATPFRHMTAANLLVLAAAASATAAAASSAAPSHAGRGAARSAVAKTEIPSGIESEGSSSYHRTGVLGDPDHWIDYGDGDGGGRPGEKPSPFRPLRVRFETGALESRRRTSDDASLGARIDAILADVLPRAGRLWSSALAVVPVRDRLRVSPHELAPGRRCGSPELGTGGVRVPDAHVADGVADADLVLYVSDASSEALCAGGPTAALPPLVSAAACNFDQWDRPTAGALGFCLGLVEVEEDGAVPPAVADDLVDAAVGQIGRVLGMSPSALPFFRDPRTGQPRTARPFAPANVTCVDGVRRTAVVLPDESTLRFSVDAHGRRNAHVVTEKVAQVVRNQFDCPTAMGAQLENLPTGGSSSCFGEGWDTRLFYGETMSWVGSPTGNSLSPLTLALLEDSGWYKANYSAAHVSSWGHGAGCDFVNKPCLQQHPDSSGAGPVVPDYGRGYFCASANERGCSPARTHKMACTVIDYDLFFPRALPDAPFQYFPERPSLGGPRPLDFCPVYGSTYAGLRADQLDCRDPENADLMNLYSEDFATDSMCFETSSDEGRCYTAQCVTSEYVLKVEVGGEWHTCERDHQELSVRVGNGAIAVNLTCPRLGQACPDMFCPSNCGGRGVCNFGALAGVDGKEVRPRCECFDPDDASPDCAGTDVPDGAFLLAERPTPSPTDAPTLRPSDVGIEEEVENGKNASGTDGGDTEGSGGVHDEDDGSSAAEDGSSASGLVLPLASSLVTSAFACAMVSALF